MLEPGGVVISKSRVHFYPHRPYWQVQETNINETPKVNLKLQCGKGWRRKVYRELEACPHWGKVGKMEKVGKVSESPIPFFEENQTHDKSTCISSKWLSWGPGRKKMRVDGESEQVGAPHSIRLKAKRGLFPIEKSVWRTEAAGTWLDLHFERPLCNGKRAGEGQDWKLGDQVGEKGCGPDEKGEELKPGWWKEVNNFNDNLQHR